jgi:hypothetical protein
MEAALLIRREPGVLVYAEMVKRSGNDIQAQEGRLKKLAQNIEALADKDEAVMRHARDIVALRRTAASELYGCCWEFVNSLNQMLPTNEVGIDPPDFPPDAFQEHITNLIQINVRGRILRVEFDATPELISTEDFRIPYTLQGYVRAFNQALLDKDLIEEQCIFYTVERDQKQWRFFDARTYRSGAFDQDYLISLMEELI